MEKRIKGIGRYSYLLAYSWLQLEKLNRPACALPWIHPILVDWSCLLSQGPSWSCWNSPFWHLFFFPYNLISQLQPTLSSTSTGFSWEDWGTSIFKLTAFLWSEFQMFAHSWQAWQLYSRYFIVNDVVISQVSWPWEQKIINLSQALR